MTDENAADLRRALAEAERARAAAVARLEELQELRHNERREEQHDLRNLLAVVRAIARRSADGAHTVEEYCGLLDGRLSAYLHAQATIARERPRGVDLLTLVADELLRFGIRAGEDVDLHGPAIQLSGRAAGLLALAFHELASERILIDHPGQRHDLPGERLQVAWQVDPADPATLAIEWRTVAPEGGERLPSRWSLWVAQAIRHQLDGSAERRVAGAAMTLDIRLPDTRWRLADTDASLDGASEQPASSRAADAAFP